MQPCTPLELQHYRYGEIALRSSQRFSAMPCYSKTHVSFPIMSAVASCHVFFLRETPWSLVPRLETPTACRVAEEIRRRWSVATLSRRPVCLGIRHSQYGSAAGCSTRALSLFQCWIFKARAPRSVSSSLCCCIGTYTRLVALTALHLRRRLFANVERKRLR